MSNNLTLSVTLTGDGKQLSGTLKNAQGEVQAFGGTTEREGGRAERSLANVERRAGTVGRELQVLRRLAAPVGAALAGMFATRALQGQVDYADQLQKTNLRIGASVEALSQYNHVASLSGVAFGNLTTAWQRQTRRISEAAQGTGAAKDALEALGLSAKELNQLAPEDQFERIAEALQGVESQADRTALAMKLWDTEGVGLLQITNQGADAIRAMREEADRLGLTISQDTADAMANYNDEMARFQAVATGVTRQVASELVPAMTTGLQTASEWVDQMGGAAEILDTVKDAGTGVAVVMAGRYVGAIAASQAAMTAKAAVVATTTGAINVLTGATTRQAAAATAMAGATRVAAGALALIGGPVGAAVIAAGAVIYFREELGLVPKPAITAAGAVDELAQRVDGAADSMLKFEVAAFTAELVSLQAAAQQAEENLARLERTANEPYSYGQGQQGDLTAGADRQRAQLESLNNQINAREDAIAKLTARIEQMNAADEDSEDAQRELQITIDGLNNTTEKAVAGTNELTKSTEAQSDALEDLYDRLIPGRRETVQLARDMQTLTLAMAMGTGNIGQNIQAMGLLQQQYIEAQNDTDDLADKTVKAAYTMEGAWDEVRLNGLRRLDDGFASLWEGAIDGSLNAGELMKKALAQTLAEMAHMAITRPITVQLATSMGLNGGAGGGAGGGFNGIGSLINGGKSLLGIGGGSTAAAAGGLYSGASTGLAAGGLYGNAVTGGVASTGIMSSITAGVSAAMPWIAGGLAIDSLLGGGITKAISGLFGGRSRGPSFDLMTTDQDPNRVFEDVQHGVKARSAFGNIGFYGANTNRLQETFGSFGQATEFLEAIAASDDLLASLARSPEELNAMSAAVKEVRLQASDAAGITEQLGRRTAAAIGAMNSDFGALIDSAITQIADPDKMTNALLAVLNIEDLIQSLNGQIQSDVAAHLEANTSNIQGTADSLTQAINATVLLGNSAQRLNLQFDDTAGGAIHYAWSMQEAVGGLDALNNMSASYYQNYFTASEREAMQREELTRTMQELGFELPKTREGFRELMEAQNLNTTAGVQNAAALMQLEGAFAQLTPAVSEAGDAVRSTSDILQERAQLERELLQAQGDTNALRQLDLEALDESNRALQQMVWAEEKAAEDRRERERQAAQDQRDAAAAARDAAQAYADAIRTAEQAVQSAKQQVQQSYQRFDQQSFDLQLGYLDLLGDSEAMLAMQRERELQTIDDSLRPFQERLWALQDEAKAQQQAREASRNYVSELERVRGELSGAFGNINGWIDQQQATGGTPEMNLANAQEQLARQLVLAENGDRSALQNITQYADRVLQANDAYNASSSAGQRVESDVINALKGLPKALSAEEFLAKEITDKLGEVITSFDDMIKLSLADEIERAVFASQYTIGTLIDFAVGSNDLPDDLRTVLGSQAHRLDSTINYLIGTSELDNDDRALALNVSNNLVSTVDQILGSELTWADKRLALDTTNTLSSTIDLTLGSDVSKETRRLALLNSNLMVATIDAVQSSSIADDTRALALNSTNTISTDVHALLGSNVSSAAKQLALKTYNAISTTVHAIVTSGSSETAMNLALNSTNSIRSFVRAIDHRLTDEDAKALALNSSNTLTATIQGVMASSIGDDAKKLALSKTNTLTTTIKAALADGALSRDERRLIDTQSETVVKTLKTNGGLSLNRDEWAVINAASGTKRLNMLADIAFKDADLKHLDDVAKNTADGGKSIAERAKEQLDSLNTLGDAMDSNVAALIGLDKSVLSLSGAINKLLNANENLLKLSMPDKSGGFSGSGRPTMPGAPDGSVADPSADPDTVAGGLGRMYQRFQDEWNRLSRNSQVANNTPDDIVNRAYRGVGGKVVAEMAELIRGIRTAGGDVSGGYIRDLNPLHFFAQGGVSGSHRTGLEYVPFDGYVAELHKGEKVLTADDAAALRNINVSSRALPAPTAAPLPSFPLLGKNDLAELLRDLKREVAELRKENAKLQGESNKHLAAANNQRGAAAKGQIAATERGNKMLKKLEEDKRMQVAKR